MEMEFLVEIDKNIYDISELVTKVSYKDVLNDGCSKLEFSFVDDDLGIKNGSAVRFKYNGADIFYGYVFKIEINKGKEVSITAYDQLRYAKAKDTLTVKNDTVTTLTRKMCTYFGLRKGNLTDTGYVLPVGSQQDKTWIDIIYTAISDTLVNTGRKYCLRDEFGSIAIRDLKELQLNTILGDESLCYNFNYKKSIDDDFYNLIKLVNPNDLTGKGDVIVHDSKSVETYGLLQYSKALNKNFNTSQAKSMADVLLRLYNREAETLSLECLGDTGIRAGSSFYGLISDIGLNRRLIVKSAAHSFLPVHTMSLEVMI